MPTFYLVIVGIVVGGVLLAGLVTVLIQSLGLGARRQDLPEVHERDNPS